MTTKLELFEILRIKSIDFQIHEHQPLYTVEDSEKLRGEISGSHTKNLFLKNEINGLSANWVKPTSNIFLDLFKSFAYPFISLVLNLLICSFVFSTVEQ